VWLGLGAQNYFPAVVVIFSRHTALETRRRAEVIRAFELQRYRAMEDRIPPASRSVVEYFFEPQRAASPPGVGDLVRLCRRDEGVDVAVLSQNFGSLASAHNGRVFIYECERVRGLTG
jgi:hypothetical protein